MKCASFLNHRWLKYLLSIMVLCLSHPTQSAKLHRSFAYKDTALRDDCFSVQEPPQSTTSCLAQHVRSERLSSGFQNSGVFPHCWASRVLLQNHSVRKCFTGIHTFNAPCYKLSLQKVSPNFRFFCRQISSHKEIQPF